MNPTAASLLGLLEQCGDLTGADLVRVAQHRIGDFWSLTRSQVYRELAALAEAGLVDAGPPGPRDARPYRLTDRGRVAFRAWLAEPLPNETIRIPLLLKVAFGSSLPPERLEALLDRAERDHRERLEHYRRIDGDLRAQGVDPHVRATLSFGMHYEEAVLRWFAELPAAVRGRSRDENARRRRGAAGAG